MATLNERLDKIRYVIEDDGFFNQQSLGGELNFHIFDYDPDEELIIREFVTELVKSYSHTNSKIKPIIFDLFEMILEILSSKKVGSGTILDKAIEMEEKDGTEKLIKSVSGLLKPESFISLIKEKLGDSNLVFLVGVGKAYPLVRSHTILNNLHSVLDKIPVVMFYPGSYDQKELNLFAGNKFDGLKDDNYYRAFRLVAN